MREVGSTIPSELPDVRYRDLCARSAGSPVTADRAGDTRGIQLRQNVIGMLNVAQLGVLVWIRLRNCSSSKRLRGSTVTKRPPARSIWSMFSREHSLESAT